MNEEENPLIVEPGRVRSKPGWEEDKKGRERLARKHTEALEKNDKGNFPEHDDIFFRLICYILIDH